MKERDFQVREATLEQVKDVIPATIHLKELGFDFNLANSFLSCGSEKRVGC